MKVAFWRQDSPEQDAQRARDVLASLSEEARAAFTIGRGDGDGTYTQGDWVNMVPSAVDLSNTSAGGNRVSASGAFTGTVAVYACVALIAESIASLPLLTYERVDDDRRKRVSEFNTSPGPSGWVNRLARMLHNSPNPEMTSQELWETVLGHVALWGNAYLNVVREKGRPTELWPLRPDCMEIVRDDKRIRQYKYYLPDGKFVLLPPSQVMHVRGMSLDGFTGVSPIRVARSAVAISRSAETFAERFYKQGGAPAGLLIADPPLRGDITSQKEQLSMLRDGYTEMTGGLENAHRVGVLSGVTWQQVGMDLQDAQFIESRKFQLNDIARLYRIPPHMVGDVERSTSWGTGIEQQGIGFVTYTLRPWMRRVEQAINRDLGFPGADAQTLRDMGYYAEFKVDALLRGDLKSRFEAYGIGLDKQFLTVNDVRPLENLDPVEWGDTPNELPGIVPPGAEPKDEPKPLSLVPSAEENARTDMLLAMVQRLGDPPVPSSVNVSVPDVVFPEQPTLDFHAPEVKVDLEPVARALLKLEKRAEERHREQMDQADRLLEASKPVPMVRRVERDADNRIVTVTDTTAEEAM